MSALATLTQNVAPDPVLTTGATQQTLPDWYTQFLQNLATRGTQVAGQGYQPYQGPRVAGFSPLQQQAFGQVQASAGAGQQGLTQVQQFLSQLFPQVQNGLATGAGYTAGGIDAANTAAGTANTAATGAGQQATGAAQQGTTGALNFVNQFGTAGANAAQGAAQGAAGAAGTAGAGAVGAATTAGTEAQGAVNQYGTAGVGAAAGAAGTANQALSGGPQTFPNNFSAYMSPYTSGVVDEIGRLGTRNFNENIMPAVTGSFVGNGQFGSSRNAEILGRAARDTQADITGRQANALESGFRTSADIFGADANRGAQYDFNRANTALQGGQLTSGALGQLAQLGSSTALGAGQLGSSANLGAGNLNLQALLQGGQLSSGALQQLAQLGANTSMQGGQLGANTALGAGQLGANTALGGGQLTTGAFGQGANASNQGANILGNFGTANAGALAQLAQLQQQLGLSGANALFSAGSAQQQNQQQGLNTAYQDYLDGRGFDMNQLTQLRGLMAGMQLPTGGTSVQSTPGTDYGASPLAWISALLNGGT